MITTAWHFLPADRKLRYPPHTLVEVGVPISAVGELKMCSNGMHSSERLIDALSYAPGPVLCRVEPIGETLTAADKICSRTRTPLWIADVSTTLYEFACDEAERALAAVEAEGYELDPIFAEAVAARRGWLSGDVDDETLSSIALRARSAAARSATWSVGNAVSAASDASVMSAAKLAWSAAKSATWWSAAKSAATSAQNKRLTQKIMALAR